MLLQSNEAHDSQGSSALLQCMGVGSPVTTWEVLTGTVWFKNFFFLWAHAASSELQRDETSHFVSSRTRAAQFPADLCPSFPLHSNLSFPFLSPPFSLVIPFTHILLSLSGHWALLWLVLGAACVCVGCPGHGAPYPSEHHRDSVLASLLCFAADFHRAFKGLKIWFWRVWDFHPLPNVMETNPKSRDKRH